MMTVQGFESRLDELACSFFIKGSSALRYLKYSQRSFAGVCVTAQSATQDTGAHCKSELSMQGL